MTENSRLTWHVRRAAAGDAYGIAACHIACWREAYQDLVPAHVLAAFDVTRRAEQWERDRLRYPERIHVAVAEGDVIGFAAAGPSRDAAAVTPQELHALYVRARWYGTGVADDLIRAALDPAAPCSLWVFEENPRARSFYRRHGFRLDGARETEPFTSAVTVRMVRGGRPGADVPPEDAR